MVRRLGRLAVPALLLVFGAFDSPGLVGQQRGQDGGLAGNFAADGAFTGSSLAGWRPVGGASWRAENGEIVATAKSGGWLLADKSYEDVAVVAAFRCTGACNTGVLVRAEPTADGGTKGIFVSVTGEDRASYRPRDLPRALATAGSGAAAGRAAAPGDCTGVSCLGWKASRWSAADARWHPFTDCEAGGHRQDRRVEHD
jgi:hypothetical protein